jgi:hypothetical protein
MKSFSSASFAGDYTEQLQLALAAVNEHPQALFSDFQWFLFEAKDAVYFTAFSKLTLDKEQLTRIVAEMVALAPQLSHGFVGARPGQPFPRHLLEAIIHTEEVDSFAGYPDKWLSRSPDIFAREDLPLFRVQSIVLRGGPDADGRASMVQVRASHALLEGGDSALLTRSASAARGVASEAPEKVPLLTLILGFLRAQSLAWTYILTANLLAPKEKPWGFKTLAIKRHRLRALANRLGVRQRSLYFALVTYALNGEGPDKHLRKKVIGAAYTLLGESKRNELEDDFLRVRALQAKFKVNDDFIAFVREIDDTVARLEAKDVTKFMTLMGIMMKTFRRLNRVWKGLPGKRFWRFNLGIDIALTLVPPHRAYGPLTHGIIEPIYCGAWHPAQNICTYCPGREYLTMNFSMEERHIANVDKIMPLLEKIEAMQIAPSGRKVQEDADA